VPADRFKQRLDHVIVNNVSDERNAHLHFGVVIYHNWKSICIISDFLVVAWYSHCGRTSVFDRRTFPVLRSTCS